MYAYVHNAYGNNTNASPFIFIYNPEYMYFKKFGILNVKIIIRKLSLMNSKDLNRLILNLTTIILANTGIIDDKGIKNNGEDELIPSVRDKTD